MICCLRLVKQYKNVRNFRNFFTPKLEQNSFVSTALLSWGLPAKQKQKAKNAILWRFPTSFPGYSHEEYPGTGARFLGRILKLF